MTDVATPPPLPVDPASDGAADDLWRFVVSFYGRPAVAPACLALQERLGADVIVLLFGLAALVKRGVLLGPEDVRALADLVQAWQTEIVRALRRIRTRLKSGPGPAPSGPTNALRERIKTIEIEAERIEFAVLADWLEARAAAPARADAEPSAVLRAVALHFAAGGPARLREPEIEQALAVLAEAAEQARAAVWTKPRP
jgi:uncharacterized protein (TIGR02444 family)